MGIPFQAALSTCAPPELQQSKVGPGTLGYVTLDGSELYLYTKHIGAAANDPQWRTSYVSALKFTFVHELAHVWEKVTAQRYINTKTGKRFSLSESMMNHLDVTGVRKTEKPASDPESYGSRWTAQEDWAEAVVGMVYAKDPGNNNWYRSDFRSSRRASMVYPVVKTTLGQN